MGYYGKIVEPAIKIDNYRLVFSLVIIMCLPYPVTFATKIVVGCFSSVYVQKYVDTIVM